MPAAFFTQHMNKFLFYLFIGLWSLLLHMSVEITWADYEQANFCGSIWKAEATVFWILLIEASGAVGEGLCGPEERSTPIRSHAFLQGFARFDLGYSPQLWTVRSGGAFNQTEHHAHQNEFLPEQFQDFFDPFVLRSCTDHLPLNRVEARMRKISGCRRSLCSTVQNCNIFCNDSCSSVIKINMWPHPSTSFWHILGCTPR